MDFFDESSNDYGAGTSGSCVTGAGAPDVSDVDGRAICVSDVDGRDACVGDANDCGAYGCRFISSSKSIPTFIFNHLMTTIQWDALAIKKSHILPFAKIWI